MDLARAPCRAPLTARKKGSGYENGAMYEEDPGDEVVSGVEFTWNAPWMGGGGGGHATFGQNIKINATFGQNKNFGKILMF